MVAEMRATPVNTAYTFKTHAIVGYATGSIIYIQQTVFSSLGGQE